MLAEWMAGKHEPEFNKRHGCWGIFDNLETCTFILLYDLVNIQSTQLYVQKGAVKEISVAMLKHSELLASVNAHIKFSEDEAAVLQQKDDQAN